MRHEGIGTNHRGQHRAGKHTKKAQELAKKQPREPKDNGGLFRKLFGKNWN